MKCCEITQDFTIVKCVVEESVGKVFLSVHQFVWDLDVNFLQFQDIISRKLGYELKKLAKISTAVFKMDRLELY